MASTSPGVHDVIAYGIRHNGIWHMTQWHMAYDTLRYGI